MQTSFDSLLVALLLALSPLEHDGAPGQQADAQRPPFYQGNERFRLRLEAHDPSDTSDCRYFVDAVARGNCMVRTSRTISKASGTVLAFPDQTMWIAPGDPGMPFRYSPILTR